MARKVDVFFSRGDLEEMLERFPIADFTTTHYNTWSHTSKKGRTTEINIFLGDEENL